MVRRLHAGFALFVLVALILTAFSVTPLAAQSETESPELTGTPVVVVAPDPTPAPETVQLTWTALAGLVSIVLTVGLGGGFAGALLIIRTVKADPRLGDAIEKLYLSAPPETQKLLRGGAVLLKEGGELADQLTDGVLSEEAVRAIVADELNSRAAVG